MLSLWDEPAAPDAPRRVWRDWVLVGLLAATAVLEALLRTDVVWPVVSFLLAVGLLPTLLWRRTHPLAAVVVVFGALSVLNVVALAMDAGSFGIYSSIYVLLLPYSLIRWGTRSYCSPADSGSLRRTRRWGRRCSAGSSSCSRACWAWPSATGRHRDCARGTR